MSKVIESRVLTSAQKAWAFREGFVPFSSEPLNSEVTLDWISKNVSSFELFSLQNIGGNSLYAFDEFDRAIRKMVSDTVPKNKKLGLMLSGGKDSTSILYALKREGYTDVVCYTYVPFHGENESMDAQLLCESLGYTLKVVHADNCKDLNAWVYALKTSETISFDFAYPAVCRIHSVMAADNIEVVIDGMGNDLYMGHIPPKAETIMKRFSLVRVIGFGVWAKDYFCNLPFLNWKLKYLLSSVFMHPLERMFSGSRLNLRELELLKCDTDSLMASLKFLNNHTSNYSEYDQRAYVRGLLFDEFGAIGKSRASANAYSLRIVFPFLNQDFAKYYKSLDVSERFDWRRRVNKIALRKYLQELRAIYSVSRAEFNGRKGSFRFNYEAFLKASQVFIETSLSKIESPDSRVYVDLLLTHLKGMDYYSASKVYILLSYLIFSNPEAFSLRES